MTTDPPPIDPPPIETTTDPPPIETTIVRKKGSKPPLSLCLLVFSVTEEGSKHTTDGNPPPRPTIPLALDPSVPRFLCRSILQIFSVPRRVPRFLCLSSNRLMSLTLFLCYFCSYRSNWSCWVTEKIIEDHVLVHQIDVINIENKNDFYSGRYTFFC